MIGIAVAIPQTEEQFQKLSKVILLLDEAAFHAVGAKLTLGGHDASDFLGYITNTLMRTARESKKAIELKSKEVKS